MSIKVLVCNVTCEEYAHKCKYAKCVCASKSLQRKLSTRKFTIEVLVILEVLNRAFELDLQSPKLPLQFKPQLVV